MKKRLMSIFISLLGSSIIFTNYSRAEEISNKNIINMGFVLSDNTSIENVDKLTENLSILLGKKVNPFIANNYNEITDAFKNKKIDVSFLTSSAYFIAKNESDVKPILKQEKNGKTSYYSVIFTRKDSGINKIEDLKGKNFSFGRFLSPSGYIFPKKIFSDKNIEPKLYFKNVVNSISNDHTLLDVLLKKVDGGAVYCSDNQGKNCAWNDSFRPQNADKIQAISVSDQIPNSNICVGKNFSQETASELQNAFIKLSKDLEMKKNFRKLYNTDSFVTATNKEYELTINLFKKENIDEIKKEISKESNRFF